MWKGKLPRKSFFGKSTVWEITSNSFNWSLTSPKTRALVLPSQDALTLASYTMPKHVSHPKSTRYNSLEKLGLSMAQLTHECRHYHHVGSWTAVTSALTWYVKWHNSKMPSVSNDSLEKLAHKGRAGGNANSEFSSLANFYSNSNF